MRTAWALLAALITGCALPTAGSIDPAQRTATYTVQASRATVMSALTRTGTELGLTIADASAEAGFWRSGRYRIPASFSALFVPTMDVELSATLESIAPDSVRVAVTGLQFMVGERDPRFAGPYPITRNTGPLWGYVDSLAVRSHRALTRP